MLTIIRHDNYVNVEGTRITLKMAFGVTLNGTRSLPTASFLMSSQSIYIRLGGTLFSYIKNVGYIYYQDSLAVQFTHYFRRQ